MIIPAAANIQLIPRACSEVEKTLDNHWFQHDIRHYKEELTDRQILVVSLSILCYHESQVEIFVSLTIECGTVLSS